ncbi:MAG: ABC transporter ATP-binding protein [Nanoarchaeota archaeon]|nr:ABC transporter ATP-binding protein [Nanoarchaeota archaeon]
MALYLKYLKKHKKLLFFALILATINQLFSLLDPQITRLIIDNYATKINEIPKDVFIKGVGLLLLGFIGVALVSRIAKNFQDYYVNVITQKVGTEMYSDAVQHSFSLPFESFEDQRSGELLQKMQKARQDSQALIMSFINTIFLSFVGLIFVISYAFYVNWMIGSTFLALIPLMALFLITLSKKIKKAQAEIVKESSELAGSTTETLRNVELVKSLGLENQEIGRLNSVNEKILKLELKKVKYVRLLSFVQGTLINTVRVGLLFLMLWLIFNHEITIGEFLTLFFYSFYVFAPLGELSTVVSQYQEAKASNEQLEEILKIKPKEKPENAEKINEIKAIDFKQVSFKYKSSDKNSLEDIGLKIKSGETIAFAGPSGSGKTTIIKLILGLYEPTKGKILFNGKESDKIDYDELRNKIGLVSQDIQLFAGTIRENLLFVRPEATDEQCIRSLQIASALTIIQRGNKGLDTKIGEGGLKLSGGEKQRLSIARALLRNPSIIIFDEATSSLDSLTEKEITKTIKQISKGRPELITIIVAHRLSTIAHADKIYVLEKGKIIEEGTHNSLLRKKGLYAALWREQISNGD